MLGWFVIQQKAADAGINPDWRDPGWEVLGYGRVYFAHGRNVSYCAWGTDHGRLKKIATPSSPPLKRWNLFFYPLNQEDHVTFWAKSAEEDAM